MRYQKILSLIGLFVLWTGGNWGWSQGLNSKDVSFCARNPDLFEYRTTAGLNWGDSGLPGHSNQCGAVIPNSGKAKDCPCGCAQDICLDFNLDGKCKKSRCLACKAPCAHFSYWWPEVVLESTKDLTFSVIDDLPWPHRQLRLFKKWRQHLLSRLQGTDLSALEPGGHQISAGANHQFSQVRTYPILFAHEAAQLFPTPCGGGVLPTLARLPRFDSSRPDQLFSVIRQLGEDYQKLKRGDPNGLPEMWGCILGATDIHPYQWQGNLFEGNLPRGISACETIVPGLPLLPILPQQDPVPISADQLSEFSWTASNRLVVDFTFFGGMPQCLPPPQMILPQMPLGLSTMMLQKHRRQYSRIYQGEGYNNSQSRQCTLGWGTTYPPVGLTRHNNPVLGHLMNLVKAGHFLSYQAWPRWGILDSERSQVDHCQLGTKHRKARDCPEKMELLYPKVDEKLIPIGEDALSLELSILGEERMERYDSRYLVSIKWRKYECCADALNPFWALGREQFQLARSLFCGTGIEDQMMTLLKAAQKIAPIAMIANQGQQFTGANAEAVIDNYEAIANPDGSFSYSWSAFTTGEFSFPEASGPDTEAINLESLEKLFQ